MIQCFGGYSCFFHVSKILNLQSLIKEFAGPSNLSTVDIPVTLVFGKHVQSFYDFCGEISHHGIFASPSFNSNSLRDLICSTSMASKDLTYKCRGN